MSINIQYLERCKGMQASNARESGGDVSTSTLRKPCISSYIERPRQQLPESLENQMMGLLSGTVFSFEDTWIECLGDLGRYRMGIECLGDLGRYRLGIEDEDPRDREPWVGAARF